MHSKLGITVLHVQDVARARKFYESTLGLAVIEDQSSPEFVTLHAGDSTLLGLQQSPNTAEKPATPPGAVELGFVVADVDALWRDWKNKGVKLISEPADFPYGRAFDARDPEGHPLTIYRPPA